MHQKLDGAIPFVWTKSGDEILKKANRQTTSNAGHQSDIRRVLTEFCRSEVASSSSRSFTGCGRDEGY